MLPTIYYYLAWYFLFFFFSSLFFERPENNNFPATLSMWIKYYTFMKWYQLVPETSESRKEMPYPNVLLCMSSLVSLFALRFKQCRLRNSSREWRINASQLHGIIKINAKRILPRTTNFRSKSNEPKHFWKDGRLIRHNCFC